jgi:hypothetical protein
VVRQATTDDRGLFLLPDLQAGVYGVTITAFGFAVRAESGVQVAENTVRRLDVQLQLAAVGQTVTVNAEAAPRRCRRTAPTSVSRSRATK